MKLYDKDNNEIGTGTAGNDGVATITVANNIPVGNVTAKATDASGNTSDASAPKGATDTTKSAKPVVETDLTGKAGTKTPVVVEAEPGSTVELFDKDGNKIGEATAGDDGKATIIPTKDIPAGNVTAKATDKAGNPSEETVELVTAVPKVKVPVESFGNLTKAETEDTTTKPKASQNILPNTGSADGLGIFSAAAASILAGLGLIIPVKKEDEEEEETQSN